MKSKHSLTSALTSLLSIYMILIFIPTQARALSKVDIGDMLNQHPFYSRAAECSAGQRSSGTPQGTNTYILGDSISYGLHLDHIEDKIKTAVSGDAKVNYDGGRSITQPGIQISQSALDGAEADKDYIAKSKIIIVVLGTNQTDSPFNENLIKMMQKLKGIASGAKYYWIDIGATSGDQAQGWSARNKIIYDNAQGQGYTVISRYKAMFGQDKDPLNIDPSLKVPGSSDNIHGGYPQLSQAVVEAISGQGGSSSSQQVSGGSCCKSASVDNITGSDNQEKSFNFFVGKGLEPFQAAGIVGNMMTESGTNIDPTATNSSSGAHGIAQWLGGRLETMRKWTTDQGMDPESFDGQIHYLWYEVSEGSEAKGGFDPLGNLKKTTSVEEAASVWELKFERSGGAGVDLRIRNAVGVLTKYGSGSPSSVSTVSSSSSTSTGCGNSQAVTTSKLNYHDAARNRDVNVTISTPSGNGPFPLVIFAHGWQKGPDAYSRFTDAIAKKGYIVAAPSFQGADEHGVGWPSNRDQTLPQEPGDIKFALDKLLAESSITSKLKQGSVAVVGHSDGAIDALRVGYSGSYKDSRVTAVVAISGDDYSPELSSGPPALIMHSDKDEIANYAGDVSNYNKITAKPKYLVKIIGAKHFEPIATSTPQTPAIDAMVVAFLANQLNGQNNDLTKLANQESSNNLHMENSQ